MVSPMNRFLSRSALFRHVPPQHLQPVADVSELLRFAKGQIIFEEHEPAEAVWLIQRGWVYLVKRTPHGTLATIFTMTPDEAICGVSAFDRGTYSAGAVAATDTQVIKIPADAFAVLLERNPRFAKRVLQTCCNRIRHMAETISLGQAPVESRLAYTLLRLRESFGDTIPVTHHELARMAGTRWETSIRVFSRMKRRGWITSSRGQVTIRQPQRLQQSLRIATDQQDARA